MTPREKASELINLYNLIILDTALGGSNKRSKQCAILTVNEIIKEWSNEHSRTAKQNFWEQVKQEIERL